MGRKSKFGSKIKILVKMKIFFISRNFCHKSIFVTKIFVEIFGKKMICDRKFDFWKIFFIFDHIIWKFLSKIEIFVKNRQKCLSKIVKNVFYKNRQKCLSEEEIFAIYFTKNCQTKSANFAVYFFLKKKWKKKLKSFYENQAGHYVLQIDPSLNQICKKKFFILKKILKKKHEQKNI